MTDPREVVVWSADVTLWRLIRTLLKRNVRGSLQYVKLDRLFLTKYGLWTISLVRFLGYEVFADAKIAEVPSKVLEIAKLHLRHKPWMLNVMANIASTGRMDDPDPDKIEVLKRFADLCRENGTRSCAVTVLTSKSEDDGVVADEFNGRTTVQQVLVYTEMLLAAGFTDLVCSPLEVAAIRNRDSFDGIELNTPGIRLADSSTHDQSRTDTPKAAIAAGVNRLVIGRDLTGGNFAKNFALIAINLNE